MRYAKLNPKRIGQWGSLVLCAVWLAACQQEMANQPKYKPYSASTFFEDGRAARPLVEDTVARDHLRTDTHFYTGKVDGELVTTLPFLVTRELLARGRERYTIYCTPCHDAVGTGQGMVVRRGFRRPPSYHIDRLRQAPIGHFFDVMTHGFGVMSNYAVQVPPGDRWAIAAYIRALQLSQHATLAEVPAEKRRQLQGMTP